MALGSPRPSGGGSAAQDVPKQLIDDDERLPRMPHFLCASSCTFLCDFCVRKSSTK